MSHDHHVQLPKAFWGLKIAETVLAVIVLALACYEVAIVSSSYAGFTIFTTIFTIGALVYYFVAVHSQHHAYNWIALVVLESIAVVFWLVVWALLAAALSVVYYYNDGYYYKRSPLTKRVTYGEAEAYGSIVYAILAFELVEWILYCVTLGFLAAGIHKHRKAGRPMVAGGDSSSSGWNSAPKEEKHNMQPMPAQQQYYAPDQQQQGTPAGFNDGFTAAEAPSNRY